MMQNLKSYCRQTIEALAEKQCQFGYIYQFRLEHIIVQGANKISYDSLSNLKLLKELLYIFFYIIKEMSEFCKSVKL